MAIMTTHLSPTQIEQYRWSDLPPKELLAFSDHIHSCDHCARLLHETAAPSIPEFLAGAEHLSYEQITAFLESKLDPVELQTVRSHLAGCSKCEGEIKSIRAFDLRMVGESIAKPTFWRKISHAAGRVSNRQLKGREQAMKPEVAETKAATSRRSLRSATWWIPRVGWAVAATAAVAAGIVFLPRITSKKTLTVTNNLTLQWPAKAPFDIAVLQPSHSSGVQLVPLAKELPRFDSGAATLGASGDDRFMRWRLATVIVRSENGFGSGAVISPDGWVLTNYHVVADAAQKASLVGEPATLDVITAHVVEGQVKPQTPVKATLYKADPVLDLALLKLSALPARDKSLPYFSLAAQVRDGESCYVIGSQGGGPAWWIRQCKISQEFDLPDDLSQVAAGMNSEARILEFRGHQRVIVTDAPISGGDSGGPLLDGKGELVGLTFATPGNRTEGRIGWHVALRDLRRFLANLPVNPQGIPFDAWSAGLPELNVVPKLVDGDHDGRIDSLIFLFIDPATASKPKVLGETRFVDFSERMVHPSQDLDLVPSGLWGVENRGDFRFNVFLTIRVDDVIAVGYVNDQGIVDNIRIGRMGQSSANLVWSLSSNGNWHAARPSVPTLLIDPARLGRNNLARLRTIAGAIVGESSKTETSGKTSATPMDRGEPDKGPHYQPKSRPDEYYPN